MESWGVVWLSRGEEPSGGEVGVSLSSLLALVFCVEWEGVTRVWSACRRQSEGPFSLSFEDLSGSEDSRALAFWATAGPLLEVIFGLECSGEAEA